MLLSELLKNWPCTLKQGSIRIRVRGITEASHRVQKGDIFIARKGREKDGAHFLKEAAANGCSAVIVDRTNVNLDSLPADTTVIIVPDCTLFLAYASAVLAGNPASELTIVAVTGTNGKTTVSHFISQLLQAQGRRTAIIGTTGVFINGVPVEATIDSMTTLPAEFLHPTLKLCLDRQVDTVILEASSLGLAANRLAYCPIDLGVVLNIGADHYEEHGSKQAYINAKKRLFQLAEELIVNEDDPVCLEMAEGTDKRVLYFGRNRIGHQPFPNERLQLSVVGDYNKQNAKAAICVLTAMGYSLEEALEGVSSLELPEGRLQYVKQDGVEVFIDYAHTPEALQLVLQALQERCPNNLITVFGCGGDRDREKRPQMGAAAALASSLVIITTDNPRSEEPSEIILDILSGTLGFSTPVEILMDRRQAIHHAILEAEEGDIVLIAGKGHEKIQQIGDETLPFSDVREAIAALAKRKK